MNEEQIKEVIRLAEAHQLVGYVYGRPTGSAALFGERS